LGIELFDLEKNLVESLNSNSNENQENSNLDLFNTNLKSLNLNPNLEIQGLEAISSNKAVFDSPILKNFDRVAIEAKINMLRSEYDQIGGIDPMVIDEYKEMQERFNLLVNESKDLEEAIEQLKEVVKEMDKKIHEAFVGAFKQINEEFTKYFRILFNGGNAKLFKINVEKVVPKVDGEENLNDSNGDENEEILTEENLQSSEKTELGIEISATPPNKKVKHLLLLSGGERTLTSIAMLFAVIAYNPPPFIILDEVEAALDEANSRRLAKIFAELSSKTQFIIITHNRETMRHSDVLYGVTMGNDGISQVLSVKLEQIKSEVKVI
jgi:chromosome segregation protein